MKRNWYDVTITFWNNDNDENHIEVLHTQYPDDDGVSASIENGLTVENVKELDGNFDNYEITKIVRFVK